MKISAAEPETRDFRRSRESPAGPLDPGELALPSYLDLLAVTLALAAARPSPRSGDTDPEDLYGDFA